MAMDDDRFLEHFPPKWKPVRRRKIARPETIIVSDQGRGDQDRSGGANRGRATVRDRVNVD
jgi:hypothetical protein